MVTADRAHTIGMHCLFLGIHQREQVAVTRLRGKGGSSIIYNPKQFNNVTVTGELLLTKTNVQFYSYYTRKVLLIYRQT